MISIEILDGSQEGMVRHVMMLVVAAALFIQIGYGQAKTGSGQGLIQQCKNLTKEASRPTGPGVTVLVTQGKRVLLRSARLQADIELGVPLTTSHVFRIASITEIFVAALVIKLSEEGRLSLDNRLSRYLPEIPNSDSITIR